MAKAATPGWHTRRPFYYYLFFLILSFSSYTPLCCTTSHRRPRQCVILFYLTRRVQRPSRVHHAKWSSYEQSDPVEKPRLYGRPQDRGDDGYIDVAKEYTSKKLREIRFVGFGGSISSGQKTNTKKIKKPVINLNGKRWARRLMEFDEGCESNRKRVEKETIRISNLVGYKSLLTCEFLIIPRSWTPQWYFDVSLGITMGTLYCIPMTRI